MIVPKSELFELTPGEQARLWLPMFTRVSDKLFYTLCMSRICVGVGRMLGCSCRQALTMMFMSFEKTDGIGLYLPVSTLLYRPFMSLAWKGGFRANISYNTQPMDQMSLLES